MSIVQFDRAVSLRSWRDARAGERAVHVFATKTKALAREIPPATQATGPSSWSLDARTKCPWVGVVGLEGPQ